MRTIAVLGFVGALLGGCATSEDQRSLSRGWPPTCGRVLGGCEEAPKAMPADLNDAVWDPGQSIRDVQKLR